MHPIIKLAGTLFILPLVPLTDRWLFGHITGFSILSGFLLCIGLWVRLALKARSKAEDELSDERLRRRALLHLNGGA